MDSPKIKANIDTFTTAIAGASAIFVMISIEYNFIYFWTLGIPMNKIPMTFSDHVLGFNAWLHTVAVTSVIYIIIFGAMVFTKTDSVIIKQANTTYNQTNKKYVFRAVSITLAIMTLVLVIVDFLESGFLFVHFLYYFVGIFSIALNNYNAKRNSANIDYKVHILFIATTAMLYTGEAARAQAYTDINRLYNFEIINFHSTRHAGKVLRTFENGVLFYSPGKNKINFIYSRANNFIEYTPSDTIINPRSGFEILSQAREDMLHWSYENIDYNTVYMDWD